MGSIAQTVESILGASQVTPWESLAEPWLSAAKGAIALNHWPECVAFPKTPTEMAAVVACAQQHQWRILPCGHASKLTWGNQVTGADVVISTQHLNQVIEHAEGDLTVTAQAGVPFADLQAQLLATRQLLAIDPAYPDQATLGGIVATRDTGALRQRYGGIRDMLIGVSFVRHDGQIAKAGGRVVKNVAGYDLMKLMTGSFGTLGILTQLTFRTYPLPEVSQTIVLRGSVERVQLGINEVLQSSLTPVALDLLAGQLIPGEASADLAIALRFQSIEAGVLEQVERLQAIAKPHELSCERYDGQADADFWQSLNRQLFSNTVEESVLCKIGILPAQAVDLLEFCRANLALDTWQCRIHAGSGIGTLRLSAAHTSVQQLQRLRSRCQAAGGYLTLLETPPAWKEQLHPWDIDQSTQLMMTRLRSQFDPQARLSQGRMD